MSSDKQVIHRLTNSANEDLGWMFFCPGCRCGHRVTTPPWTFNGDLVSPTIRNSVLVNAGKACPTQPVCHSFVTDGQIQFLNDCTHELAGQTVPLQPF